MRVHLFNPQNDLALASGSPTFTAPASARNLARSGAALPMWYARPGDAFIGAVNAQWYDSITSTFGIEVVPFMPRPENDSCQVFIEPWGWSPAIRRQLLDMGFCNDILPSAAIIEGWRELSSRITSAEIISHLIATHTSMVSYRTERCKPFIACTLEDALRHIHNIGVAMIKLPWSSSGRGQQVSDRTTPDELVRRLSGMIRRQGAVEITPFYDKLLDFAMLWENGKFVGYSLFITDTHGGWTHNLLLTDREIERRIICNLDACIDLQAVRNTLSKLLYVYSRQYNYTGPIGVDFIVTRQGNLIPVEINWRHTMGHVAHNLRERFLHPDTSGTFRIESSTAVTIPFQTIGNCIIKDRTLAHGLLDLVPPGGDFRFLLETTS